MTTLTITPNLAKKTAKFAGAVAAGEHVEVTLKFGASITDTGSLRMRVVGPCGTLAIFPQPESEDAWEVDGEDLKCVLNLNTIQMLKALAPAIEAELLVVLDDAENHVLYFKDTCAFKHWPMRRGDDTPYDLDGFPGLIEEWREEVGNLSASVEKVENVATISITNKDGSTTTATIRDGERGQPGPPGPSGSSDWSDIRNKPASYPPSAHASTHAAGGSDPIAPASIGALAATGGTVTGDLAVDGSLMFGPYADYSKHTVTLVRPDGTEVAMYGMLDEGYEAVDLFLDTYRDGGFVYYELTKESDDGQIRLAKAEGVPLGQVVVPLEAITEAGYSLVFPTAYSRPAIGDENGVANSARELVMEAGSMTLTMVTGNERPTVFEHGGIEHPLAYVEDVPTSLAGLAGDATHRTVTDAEKASWNGKQDALAFDDAPSAGSARPVKSGGVHAALAAKADKGGDVYVKSYVDGGVQHYVKQTMVYDSEMAAWGAEWDGDYVLDGSGEFVEFE